MGRRTGDAVEIEGGYQYRALYEGNAVQRFWHRNKQTTIARLLPPDPADRVIDVGCGSGIVSSFLAQNGSEVLGIDANPDAIAFAREHFQRPNLTFREGLVDEEFQSGGPIDKIYCLELIEHVYEEQARAMLEHFARILRPGGAVYMTTPNYRSLWPMIEWLMDVLGAAPQMAGHQHVTRYHRRKLEALAMRVGLRVAGAATTCFAAPWLAPLSQRLAQRVDALETGLRLLPGSILVLVLRKDATP